MFNHKIVNTETGEETIVPLSAKEVKIVEANIAKAQQDEIEEQRKAQLKNAAISKLTDLG